MFRIEAIPAFSDNYIWCLHDGARACVVDPGDAAPVEAFLQERALRLEWILVTHHHYDHCGGLPALAHHAARVCGSPVAGVTTPLGDGDRVSVLDIDFDVLAVPGHTLDHLAFYTPHSPLGPLLFCGDTLFAGGCGRLFEGTPRAMQRSLARLRELPGETQVYCAHEYTRANLEFALRVEPGNDALQQRLALVRGQRERGEVTLPSRLDLECATNPFLRWEQPGVAAAARARGATDTDAVAVFSAIRHWKDAG